MGLLDDAIREHLELKRRRGADGDEIARQEQEALGPPRRGDFEPVQAPVAEHAEEIHHPEHALDEPGEFAAETAPTTLHAVEDLPVESDQPRPHGDPADHLSHATDQHSHLHDRELAEPPRPQGDPADHLPHATDQHPHVHDRELAEPPRPQGDPADHLPHVESAPVEEHRVVEPPPPAPSHASQPTREFDPDEVRAAAGEPETATPAQRAEEDEDGDEEPDVLEETPEFLQETPEHDRLWFEQRPPRDFDF